MPNNNTVSYPTALKLHKAGWVKEVDFKYIKKMRLQANIARHESQYDLVYDPKQKQSYINKEDWYYAPTFQEIWDELPKAIKRDKPVKWDYLSMSDGFIGYSFCITEKLAVFETDNDNFSATEAAAEMWLLGRKEGWIK